MEQEDQPDYDYDAWQKAGSPTDPVTGHAPDTYKLPNHITFSDESIYHGKDGNQGGHWEQAPDQSWTFTPGPTNLKNHSREELQDYFNRVEPGNRLNLPPEAPSDGTAGRALRGTPEKFMGTDILSQPAQTDTLKFIMEHLRIKPEAWDRFMAAQTPSTHIEDRRNETLLGVPHTWSPRYGAEKLEEWLQR